MTPERQIELLSDAVWQASVTLTEGGFRPHRMARAVQALHVGLQMAGLPLTDPDLIPHREPEWPERDE